MPTFLPDGIVLNLLRVVVNGVITVRYLNSCVNFQQFGPVGRYKIGVPKTLQRSNLALRDLGLINPALIPRI